MEPLEKLLKKPHRELTNLEWCIVYTFDRDGAFVAAGAAAELEAAQQNMHPTLGILAAFQAFIYAVKFSILTAFRRPPQRG